MVFSKISTSLFYPEIRLVLKYKDTLYSYKKLTLHASRLLYVNGTCSLFLVFLFVAIGQTGQSQQQTESDSIALSVTVRGIDKLKGNLRIAIYDINRDFASADDILDYRVIPVRNLEENVRITVVKDREYAIAILYDVSRNGKMDFNIFGYPKEPYGFSNNPGIWYRKPTFSECSFIASPGIPIQVEI